jgi:GLPGLI family protein
MKSYLLIGALLAGAFQAAIAQKPDTAKLLVHYKFTHVTDTTDRAHPYTENMVLVVGKTASVYKSYDGMVSDAQFRKAYAAAQASGPDSHVELNRSGAGMRPKYYQYPNAQKLLTEDYVLATEYLITGPMPAIDWKISSDTATFGGLHCQKATGHFKGRDYIVWFCPDLPVHAGPWKLNDLPGVIVDAHDTKNEVIFQFDGVEKAVFTEVKPIAGANVADKDVPPILRGLDDNPNIIAPPARAIRATQKEYDKLRTGMQKNPNALAQVMVAADHGGSQVDHVLVKGVPGGHMENNPIELPEKK